MVSGKYYDKLLGIIDAGSAESDLTAQKAPPMTVSEFNLIVLHRSGTPLWLVQFRNTQKNKAKNPS